MKWMSKKGHRWQATAPTSAPVPFITLIISSRQATLTLNGVKALNATLWEAKWFSHSCCHPSTWCLTNTHKYVCLKTHSQRPWRMSMLSNFILSLFFFSLLRSNITNILINWWRIAPFHQVLKFISCRDDWNFDVIAVPRNCREFSF